MWNMLTMSSFAAGIRLLGKWSNLLANKLNIFYCPLRKSFMQIMFFCTTQAAVETMTKVGEQINEMKKKYEATVKLQVHSVD